ncbi:MAG: hypothetical protein OEW68_09160 [Gammaproteobacteria bacterium]|nr:hypothetical protein [Gammaproteobacteria bacterium]MDH4314995.1 hypothetical protein [Gammaproteobacteria bacterium]
MCGRAVRAASALTALCLSAFSLAQPVVDEKLPDTCNGDERQIAHVLTPPVQLELKGPSPFNKKSGYTLGGFAMASGLLEVIAAGYAIENAIDYSREKGESRRSFNQARPLGETFDFHEAVMNGIEQVDDDTELEIVEVHQQKYESRRRIVRSILLQTDAEAVICIEPTYFISPGLDQLRLVVQVFVYTQVDPVDLVSGPYDRYYEYLSPSRGKLFRPFCDGEKAALMASTNEFFDRKTQLYPHNRNAYEKDRKQAIEALENRDTVLPEMAISERWPADSMDLELQSATDQIMQLIRNDLMNLDAVLPEDAEYVTFAALDFKGKPKLVDGYAVSTLGTSTIYRDENGNVFSVPGN